VGNRQLRLALFVLIATTGAVFAARGVSRQWVKRVVSVHHFEWRNRSGQRVGLGRLDDILGPPDVKYPFVGAGGELVVDMGQGDEIVDRPGADFKVYEVGTTEHFWVLAAQQVGGPWHFVGYGFGVSDFDLGNSPLPWARYLVLADHECIVEGTPSEGSDFDAVENFHPTRRGERLETTRVLRGSCLIGKWRYDGRFNCKPKALENLLKAYDRTVGSPVPSHFDYVDSDIEEKFFSSAILFMTGHRNFILDERQRAALREYIERGGFLLGDACCGNRPFADAFYREANRVFPEIGFVRLPADHDVYRCFHSVSANTLPLYALIRDGRAIVVFSPNGLVCSWEGEKCPGEHRMLPEPDATQLGVNLIVYALTR